MADRYEGYAYTVPSGISTAQAARIASKIAEVRRRVKRRHTIDKIVNIALYSIFVLAGITGIVLCFEMFSFLLRG